MKGVAIAVVLAMPAPASAESMRSARITADGVCDLAGLDVRTNELLGRTAIVDGAAARISIVTADRAGAVTATLTFADNAGTQSARTLDAASCAELIDPLAIVLSLLLREDTGSRAAPERPLPPLPPAPPEPETEVADIPVVPARTRSRMLELAATMGTGGTGAIILGGRVERRRHALGLELHAGLPSATELGVGTVRVMTAKLDAVACYRHGGFGACGLVMAGLVHGRGEDLMTPQTSILPMAGVGARLEWRQPMSRWGGVRLFADVEQLLSTTRFLVDAIPVWTSDARQAWLGAGIYFYSP